MTENVGRNILPGMLSTFRNGKKHCVVRLLNLIKHSKREELQNNGASDMAASSTILRNGSGFHRPAPEVLKTDQHSQHPFKLAVEMHLVPAQTL